MNSGQNFLVNQKVKNILNRDMELTPRSLKMCWNEKESEVLLFATSWFWQEDFCFVYSLGWKKLWCKFQPSMKCGLKWLLYLTSIEVALSRYIGMDFDNLVKIKDNMIHSDWRIANVSLISYFMSLCSKFQTCSKS